MISLRRLAARSGLWVVAGSGLLFVLFAVITAWTLRGDIFRIVCLCGVTALAALTTLALARRALHLRSLVNVARAIDQKAPLREDLLAAAEFAVQPQRGELRDLFIARIDESLARTRPNPARYARGLQLRAPGLLLAAAVVSAGVGVFSPQTTTGFALLLAGRDGHPPRPPSPIWSSLVLDLTFPSHTGRQPQSLVNPSGVLRVPAGTEVGVNVTPLDADDLRLTLVTDDSDETAEEVALVEVDGELLGQFVIRSSGSWQLHATGREAPTFPIELEVDQPPEIELLPLPRSQANAAETDVVDLRFRARDDFGLAAAELVFEVPEVVGETDEDAPAPRVVRLPIDPPPPGARVWNHHYSWDLKSLSVDDRVELSYWIEVRDNDPGLGLEPLPDPPGKVTRSAVLQLRVEDAESRHEENLVALRELRDAAVDLLATRMTSPALSEESGETLLPRDRLYELRSVLAASAMLLGQLSQAIEALSVDTLAPERDVAVLSAIHERLVKLHRDETQLHEQATFTDTGLPSPTLPTAFAGLVRHNAKEVAGLEDEIIRLDDLVDTQIMEQIESLVARLQASQQKLVELLEALKAGDESVRAEIELLHQRVRDDLRRVAEARSMLRKELNSEFLNSDAFAAMEQQVAHQDVMEQLRRGDVDGALQQARDALSEIQKLRDDVQGKLADTPQAQLSPEEQARLDLLRELSRIQDAQTGVKGHSRELHQQQRASQADLQVGEKQATSLAKQVEKLLEQFDEVRDARLGRNARNAFEDGRQALKRLQAELNKPNPSLLPSAERAQEALMALEDAARHAQGVERESAKVERLRDGGNRVRDELRNMLPKPSPTGEQQAEYESVDSSQQGLRQRAQALLDSEQSAPLPEHGREALKRAAGYMGESSQQLGKYEPSDALYEQQHALQEIEQAIASLRKSSPPPPTGSQQRHEASTEAERDRSLRDAVVEAMKEDPPDGFDEPVQRYYEDLLQ